MSVLHVYISAAWVVFLSLFREGGGLVCLRVRLLLYASGFGLGVWIWFGRGLSINCVSYGCDVMMCVDMGI